MDEFIKFNNQTAGRDKVFRLAQYIARMLWHNLEKNGAAQENVERLKKVDETLGVMRRLLRFGRFFETFHSAMPVFSSVSNPVVRFTSAMSRISGGCYMLMDHIVCLDKLGVISLEKSYSSKLDKLSSRFWLYAILLGLLRDLYEFLQIYREEYSKRFHLTKQNSSATATVLEAGRGSELLNEAATVEAAVAKTIQLQKHGHLQTIGKYFQRLSLIGQFVQDHADVTVDTSKNLCDLFLPLTSLGYVKLNPSTVSCLGVASTILSAIPMLNPMVKMVPAT